MLIPHEKCPLRVAKKALLLLFMQYRFHVEWKGSITSCFVPDPDIFAFDKLPTGAKFEDEVDVLVILKRLEYQLQISLDVWEMIARFVMLVWHDSELCIA